MAIPAQMRATTEGRPYGLFSPQTKEHRMRQHIIRYSTIVVLATQLTAFAGMTLSADRMAADGVVAKSLSCTLTSGGMMGLIGIVAGLASKKAALDACLGKQTVGIKWSAPAGTIATISSTSGDATARACVEKALKGTSGLPTGDCSATISVE